MVPIEIFPKLRFRGIQAANQADDDGRLLNGHQHPKVVFHPGTRLHYDSAADAERLGALAVVARQERRRMGSLRKGRALWTGRIVKMQVRVDDGEGSWPRPSKGSRRCCASTRKECPPAQRGVIGRGALIVIHRLKTPSRSRTVHRFASSFRMPSVVSVFRTIAFSFSGSPSALSRLMAAR